MQIDWTHFTPWVSLVGGVVLGATALILLAFNGRIAGISGILGALLRKPDADTPWRAAFLAGMLIAPWLVMATGHAAAQPTDASWPTVLVAGFLVGIGTRYASGCTSGHGVCGLSRGSLRSLVATLCFMASGFATVYVVRHVVGG